MKAKFEKVAQLAVAASLLAIPFPSSALQNLPAPPASSASVARVIGTVTAVEGDTVTVKSDAGVVQKIVVGDATRMLQTVPGETTLGGATKIQIKDLQVGDRVSTRGTMSPDGASLTAISLIAMKQADLQKKQEADREDWQKRGISGVVKSVDVAAGTVTVTTGSGTRARTLMVHVEKATAIRRYAADTAKLEDAKPAKLDQVQAGDQIEARGTRTPDGSELAAEDIIVGRFRNLAGTVTAVDKSAGTISLTDLATHKPYVIRCTADSQLRKLSPAMAQALAARLKGQSAQASASAPASRPASDAASNINDPAKGNGPAAAAAAANDANARADGGHSGSGEAHPGAAGSTQQMLNRAPEIQLADLQKGDVVMVVATEGAAANAASSAAAGSGTVITLIAGVEQMLQASASGSQSLLSSSWSLGSGAPGGEGSQ